MKTSEAIKERRSLQEENSKLNQKIKENKQKMSILEQEIISTFLDEGRTGEVVDGKTTNLSIKTLFNINKEHLNEALPWIKDNGLFDLMSIRDDSLTKRVEELMEQGEIAELPNFVSKYEKQSLGRN